jgi:hypothetical protein
MEVEAGLAATSPVSVKMSRVYFFGLMRIPVLVQATSIPKKYFNVPRSLIVKLLLRKALIYVLS